MSLTEDQLMDKILTCYVGLSPENVWLDGEASEYEAKVTVNRLTKELKSLFKQLGREVTEEEAYNYVK